MSASPIDEIIIDIYNDKITIRISSLWWFMVKKNNLKKLINLNFIDFTNRTYLIGKFDLPYVTCSDDVNLDYLALYSETNNYYKTENTCVCFYLYDNKFDGIKGIYNAIYYNDEKLLAKYKERFKGVKYANTLLHLITHNVETFQDLKIFIVWRNLE